MPEDRVTTEVRNARESMLRQPTTWVSAAPVLCAAHCLATPVLVLALPSFAVGTAAELVLFTLSALLAVGFTAWAVGSHGRMGVALPVLVGLGIWGAGLFDLVPGVSETVTTVTGALILAAGLVWSSWLRHLTVCPTCSCASVKPH